jgi:hypothetical protein
VFNSHPEMGRVCSMRGKEMIIMRIIDKKSERRRTLGNLKNRLKNDSSVDS